MSDLVHDVGAEASSVDEGTQQPSPSKSDLDDEICSIVADLEAIIWRDHHSQAGEWMPVSEVDLELKSILTIGVVVAENAEAVAVAPTFTLGEGVKDPTIADPTTIAKALIAKRWRLRESAR